VGHFCSTNYRALRVALTADAVAGWLIGLVDEVDVTVVSHIQRTEFLQGRAGKRPLDAEAGAETWEANFADCHNTCCSLCCCRFSAQNYADATLLLTVLNANP
jgi:hypothetical protein